MEEKGRERRKNKGRIGKQRKMGRKVKFHLPFSPKEEPQIHDSEGCRNKEG